MLEGRSRKNNPFAAYHSDVERMPAVDSYRTLKGPGESQMTEKKSRFLGHCVPVSSREDALGFIAEKKAAFRDANHNVSAYYIREGNYNHSSDDGEPSGTAGLPVLEIIQKGGLTDAVIVVTRYFGGTLLGTGGLKRAYSAAAAAAVKAAGIAVMTRCALYDLQTPYPLYEPVLKLLSGAGARVLHTDFAESVSLRCVVREGSKGILLEAVKELSRGGITPLQSEEGFFPLDDFEPSEAN